MKNVIVSIYNTLFRTYTLTDCSRYDHQPQSDLSVYGVYHVYCDDGWESLVADQLDRLRSSGLANATKCLYVDCIALHEGDEERLRKLLQGITSEIFSVSDDGRVYEYKALDKVWELASAQPCLLYYFHTKGVSFHAPKENADRHFRYIKRNEEAWRKAMEYFMMDRWQVAVNVLCDGFDTYGCLRYPPRPAKYRHYAGNFWWATSTYIKKLKPIDRKLRVDRMLAEQWIFEASPHDFSAFDTVAMLYRVYLPECLYIQRHSPFLPRLRFVITYNWFKVLKKCFHYNFVKHYNNKYQTEPRRKNS